MRREANKLVIHRGVAPIPKEMLVRINGGRCLGTPEDVFIRTRLSGPAHHEVIGFHPRVPLWEWLVCMAVAAAVGAMMVSF